MRTVSPPSSPTMVGVHAQVFTNSRRSGAVRSVVETLRRLLDSTTATRRDARAIHCAERGSTAFVSMGVFHGLPAENGRWSVALSAVTGESAGVVSSPAPVATPAGAVVASAAVGVVVVAAGT